MDLPHRSDDPIPLDSVLPSPQIYLASPPDILLAASRDATLIQTLRDTAPNPLHKWTELVYYIASYKSNRTPGEEIVGIKMLDGKTGHQIGTIVGQITYTQNKMNISINTKEGKDCEQTRWRGPMNGGKVLAKSLDKC